MFKEPIRKQTNNIAEITPNPFPKYSKPNLWIDEFTSYFTGEQTNDHIEY